MNKLKLIISMIALSMQSFLYANESASNGAMNVSDAAKEVLRGNAKFNVVASILVLIFLGIVFYLFRLDKKMSKLEKQIKQK